MSIDTHQLLRERTSQSDFLHEVAPRSVFYGPNFTEEPEPLRCVGGGMASSASRYDQFFTKLNDTECVYNNEPERSWVTSNLIIIRIITMKQDEGAVIFFVARAVDEKNPKQ